MIKQKRRVVLFVDNFSGHKVPSRSNVIVEFSLLNITSVTQPLDAGIIKANKDYFRREMFRDLRSKLHTFSDVSEYIKKVTVYEASITPSNSNLEAEMDNILCAFVTLNI